MREIAEQIPEHRACRRRAVPATTTPDRRRRSAARVTWRRFALDAGAATPLAFEQLPFDHPLYIMYSSGTTGLPKCMVHGAGGTLLQHLKELVLHTDLTRDDRIFYFTTCGWMMWNWLVSSLAVGATVVLYDGAPLLRRPRRSCGTWRPSERITVFGTSAKWLALAEKEGVGRARRTTFARCKSILSTGSPLAAHSFDYVYEHVKPDVRLSSISGGTDIISCFALGNPIGPVYRGELQTRGLRHEGRGVRRRRASGASARRASWCAPRRSRACRSRSGTIPTARSIAPRTSSIYPNVVAPRRLGRAHARTAA